MENTRTPNRSNQGNNEVIMQDVAHSGQDLSYISHDGGIPFGRLIPNTFQHLMPSAKYRLANHSNITFEQLTTPLLGNVDISQHNFFVPYRAIDESFETLMTPNKLDSMGAYSAAPSFNFNQILTVVCSFLDDIVKISWDGTSFEIRYTLDEKDQALVADQPWGHVYLSDALEDLMLQISAHANLPLVSSERIVDKVSYAMWKNSPQYNRLLVVLYDVFDFFVGKRSLLDRFGYYVISHKQLDECLQDVFENAPGVTFTNFDSIFKSKVLAYNQWYKHQYPLQNEYALRAYYAIWFEYYRNFDIEPRGGNLPEWKNFGKISMFNNGQPNFSSLHYLVPRIRCWSKDKFTSAGIDDISRHVFAPVMTSVMTQETTYTANQLIGAPGDADNIMGLQMQSTQLAWRNSKTGAASILTVTLPSGILSQLRSSPTMTSYDGISLVNLRKATMLENWLKRIYYGGDEYRDRMLSLYGARIEDYRINRPQWLSSSLDSRDVRQEVSNSGALAGNESSEMATIGTRTATATATQNGSDIHSNFTPEFGIYIGILSVMPRATYDPLSYQNLQIKYSDFPIPQFANSMEDTIVTDEVCRQALTKSPFGYCAYAHAYRGRVDEVHGDYLDTKFDYVFNRSFDGHGNRNIPQLSYGWLHCRPHLPMFVNSILLDGQIYGTFIHDFYVENPLPTPVETI